MKKLTKKFAILFALMVVPMMARAIVTNTSYSVSYSCSGSTGPYAFNFPISAATSLAVIENGTTLASGLYTIQPTNNSYTNGGSVTLNAACSSGTLVLQRVTPLTQTTNYYDNMPLPYTSFMNSLDQLTEIAQEMNGQAIRIDSPQTANSVMAGPASGSPQLPAFRTLTSADIAVALGTPSQCGTGQAATGITSTGNANCTAVVNSVGNSDGSLNVSTSSGAATASLNPAHANTFTATQTFPNASISNAELANPSTTVNGQTCTLGGVCTVTVSTLPAVNFLAANFNTFSTTGVSTGLSLAIPQNTSAMLHAGACSLYWLTGSTAVSSTYSANLSSNTGALFEAFGSYYTGSGNGTATQFGVGTNSGATSVTLFTATPPTGGGSFGTMAQMVFSIYVAANQSTTLTIYLATSNGSFAATLEEGSFCYLIY